MALVDLAVRLVAPVDDVRRRAEAQLPPGVPGGLEGPGRQAMADLRVAASLSEAHDEGQAGHRGPSMREIDGKRPAWWSQLRPMTMPCWCRWSSRRRRRPGRGSYIGRRWLFAVTSRWWCQKHGSGSSQTRITRTDSLMTSKATVLRVHRDGGSSSFASNIRMEFRCVCTGPLSRLQACPAFGVCTRARETGRSLAIGPHDGVLRPPRLEDHVSRQRGVPARKQLVEPVFGIIKEQQRARRFLLRGLANVTAEWTMLATAFNLRTLYRVWSSLPPSSTLYLTVWNLG